MSYVLPQVLVFQEFSLVPAAITDPLRAHISGPHAALFRYADPDEKSLIGLGDYADYMADGGAFAWPHRPAGAEVDRSYVKLFVDDAKLKYFENLIGDDETVAPVADHPDRISITDVVEPDSGFAANTADYPRKAVLLDRDVRVGDKVWVRGIDGSDSYELNTYVKEVRGEDLASSVEACTSATQNAPTAAADVSDIVQTDGEENCVQLEVDASLYNGYRSGYVTDTYTIKIELGSAGGDFRTAKYRIRSTGGENSLHHPAVVDSWATPGHRGLKTRFVLADGPSCSLGVGEALANDLIAGQEWTFTVTQAFVETDGISAGTYLGPIDTKYIVEVTRGGLFADPDPNYRPQITCTTIEGSDASGPTAVLDENIAVPVGTHGVTIAFDGASPLLGLRKGDRWFIDVVAVRPGRMSTLVLGHSLPAAIQDADALDLRLYIQKDLVVEQNRVGFAPDTNWSVSDTEFTVEAGLIAYDASWTDAGDARPLPVEAGQMFLEYRAWLDDLCSSVQTISDVGELNDLISGPLSPDNPLKWGVYKALTNSNGTAVKFTGVCNPDDEDSWLDVLELLVGRDDVYGLVPLTHNATILNAFAAHVSDQSGPEAGRWRVLWTALTGVTEKAVVSAATSTDGAVVLATLTDDPGTSGTQYTWLQVPAGNANFDTNGVRAGDTVRYLYSTSFGETTYQEFVVDEVINEDTLRLVGGHGVEISVAQKIEVWHTLSKTEQANAIGDKAAAWGNHRVMAVWPDVVGSGGVLQDGYYLAAALAGLRSGVAPHQGLTNVELTGFDDLSRSHDFFNQAQLNIMAGKGVWVVTKNPTGNVITRHALTTNVNDLLSREEMITANTDSRSFIYQARLAPYIGRSNVTPSMLSIIQTEMDAAIGFLKNNHYVDRLGAQLIDASVIDIHVHALLRDRIVVVVRETVPSPLNNIEVHQQIVV